MSRSFSPFRNARRQVPTPVVYPDQPGAIWLMSYGSLGPIDYPPEVQTSLKMSEEDAKMRFNMIKAIDILAKRDNISIEEAREKLMPQGMDMLSVGLQMHELLGEEASEETVRVMFRPPSEVVDPKLQVSQLFMQNRLLFSVDLSVGVAVGVESIEVLPLTFPLMEGDRLKFPKGYIEVSAHTEAGSEVVPIKKSFELEAKEVGFLCKEGGRELEVGCPDWNDQLLDEEIEAIYAFYLQEDRRGRPPQEESEPSGEKPVNPGSLSTGTTSTSGSDTSSVTSLASKKKETSTVSRSA